jgi:O-antigen ligase
MFGLCVGIGTAWFGLRRACRADARLSRRAATVTVALIVCLSSAVGLVGRGSGVAGGGITHGRLREWRVAVQTWSDRPILGAGAGAYAIASAPRAGRSASRYAHDLLLEFAAELGVPGLLLGGAMYWSSARALCRARSPQSDGCSVRSCSPSSRPTSSTGSGTSLRWEDSGLWLSEDYLHGRR